MATLTKFLLGLGLLTAIAVPLAAATFPAWEWRILCWLDKRRRNRTCPPIRVALRRPR